MRNVLKCSTWHTFFTVKFWHFSSAAFIEKKRRTGTYASNNNNNNGDNGDNGGGGDDDKNDKNDDDKNDDDNNNNNNLYYNSPYGHCHSPHRTSHLWRLFGVFTDRVLSRSLCERSYNVPLDILYRLLGFGTLVRRLSLPKTQKTQFYATVLWMSSEFCEFWVLRVLS